MNYTKPEVALLGQAVSVIEGVGKNDQNQLDTPFIRKTPAYDLDE